MDIEYLREFMVLSECSSLSKASGKLSLAPSTFSRHISALEKYLNVVLIRRGTAVYELTPEGQLFLELACQVVETFDEAVYRTREMKMQKSSVLTVGGDLRLNSIMTLVANTITYLARQKAPVNLNIFERHTSSSIATIASHDNIENLLNKTLDIAVVIAHKVTELDRINSLELCQERFAFFVNKNSQLALSKEPLKLTDLRNMILVTTLAYKVMYERILEVFRLEEIELKTRVSVHRSYCDIYIARSLNELFILPESNVDRIAPVELSGLMRLEIDDPNAYFTLAALCRADEENHGISLFFDTIKELAGHIKA